MTLTIHEKKALIALQKKSPQSTLELEKSSGMPEAAVNRAIAWLEEKGFTTLEERITEHICLDSEGEDYLKNKFPERKLFDSIKDGEKPIKQLMEELGADTVKIGMVWLRKLNAAMIVNGSVKMTPDGKKYLTSKMPHEDIIEHIKKGSNVPKELIPEMDDLRKRGKILKVTEQKHRTIAITAAGAAQKGLKIEEETSVLTSEMIKSGSWKNIKIREYNVAAPVPDLIPGNLQMYYEFLDEVREKMIAMGFKEMRGNAIQTEFWNFDALIQPQLHPTRTERDTYYIKSPSKGNLTDEELIAHVKKAGEDLWKQPWDIEKSKNLILRSHTTCLSAKQLATEKKYPLKYFSIGKVFRKDVIDATHLPEFQQMEGIVADESLTLRDLLGMLEAFAIEIGGIKEVKFKSGYFPYTEPSVELFAKHPKLGWKELGGAGMFRPEMLKALGVDVPVIAWGMGIDRLAMYALGLNDIRDLFSQDLRLLQQH